MQGAVVFRHAVEVAAVGFEFLQAVCLGVVAVGTAADAKQTVVACQCHLSLEGGATAGGDGAMAGHAFDRGGRGGEAHVQVAALRREFAQGANGDFVRQMRTCGDQPGTSGASHDTWQTLTGMPWAAQKVSQRIWLSWSRSPGPFTSIKRYRRSCGQNCTRSGRPQRLARMSQRIRVKQAFRCWGGKQLRASRAGSAT